MAQIIFMITGAIGISIGIQAHSTPCIIANVVSICLNGLSFYASNLKDDDDLYT